LVWGLVAGVLPIVASVWLYRQRLKVYAVICLVPGIAALLLGYWSTQVIDDSVSDSPAGRAEGIATPAIGEGGV